MRPKTAREQLIDDVCPSLTFQQRLVGFGIFFTIGAVVTLTSMFSFSQLLTGNPVPFALKYSIGNVISLFSTAYTKSVSDEEFKQSQDQALAATVSYLKETWSSALKSAVTIECCEQALANADELLKYHEAESTRISSLASEVPLHLPGPLQRH